MRLILSTSNIMHSSPPIIARPTAKSNAELTLSLKASLKSSSCPISLAKASQDLQKGEEATLYLPTLTPTPLAEDRSAYDITIKLFHLPHAPISQRAQHAKDALTLVLKQLGVTSVDLAILSFPGISFDADDESDEPSDDPSDENSAEPNGVPHVSELKTVLPTYQSLEELYDAKIVGRIGISEFGTQRLQKLLDQARIRPSVDQINVRDCCVVPRPLIVFAKAQGIELLTHNDCTDILPSGTMRELLTPGVLAPQSTHGDEEVISQEGRLVGEITPLWVVKYTAVVKNRGVVENKGYLAAAELTQK
jgi:glutamate--cysteine ligase regulatory subunit